MSKKSSRPRDNSRRKRDLNTIAKRPTLNRLLPRPRFPVTLKKLTEISDFRINSFPLTRARAYTIINGDPVRPVRTAINPQKIWHMPHVVQKIPKTTMVCVRRKIRREVMIASGRKARKKHYHRNETSQIQCRRK